MPTKLNPKLTIAFVCILSMPQHLCQAAPRQLYATQENLVREAREKVRSDTEVADKVGRQTLLDTRNAIDQAATQPNSPLTPIRNRIDRLLNAREVRPEEMASVKADLDKAAAQARPGIEQAEYRRLGERLDVAHGIATRIVQTQQSYESTIGKLNENFNALATENDRISSWFNKLFIGFVGLVSANLVAIIGFVVKLPTMRLESRLRKLEIAEKTTTLKKAGIDLRGYL